MQFAPYAPLVVARWSDATYAFCRYASPLLAINLACGGFRMLRAN